METDAAQNDGSQRTRRDSASQQHGHEFADVARALAKPPLVVRLLRLPFLIVIYVGVLAWSVFLIWTGYQQIVTRTGVTAKKGDPTPIYLTGTTAVINGVCCVIIGCLVLAVCLLPIRVLWKRHASRSKEQNDRIS